MRDYIENLQKYLNLISVFVDGHMSAKQFESSYLTLFKEETKFFPENLYSLLNKLFIDVDDYCADPSLRDESDIDEKELQIRAKEVLQKLRLIIES